MKERTSGNYQSKTCLIKDALSTKTESNRSRFKDFEHLFVRPMQVQVDLTNRCNLNCLYCYNKKNLLKGKELTDYEFHNFIDKLILQLNPYYVTFSGGEPLLRKELLFELSKKLKDNNIEVHLNTNSLLITEEIAKKLTELNIDKININIDSFKKQDLLRGGNELIHKTLRSLNILKKHFPPSKISIAVVITTLNYKDLLEIAKFVKEEGFMEIHLLDMIPTEESSMQFFLSKQQWLEFFDIYQKIKELGVHIRPNHALLFLKEFEEYVKIPFCMAGRFKLVITADGNIVPCNYFKKQEYVCGNVLEINLLDVWQNSELLNKFRYFIPEDNKCSKCKSINLCSGGCRAMSLFVLGDAFKADPYCITYGLNDE